MSTEVKITKRGWTVYHTDTQDDMLVQGGISGAVYHYSADDLHKMGIDPAKPNATINKYGTTALELALYNPPTRVIKRGHTIF